MLGAQISKLDMPNGGVDALQKAAVSVKGGRPHAGALLQGEDILRIFGKGLLIVQRIALFNGLLKVRLCPEKGLIELLLSQAGGGLVVRPVADALAFGVKAIVYRDSVGNAILSGDRFNAGNMFKSCHNLAPIPFVMIVIHNNQ